MSQPKDAYDHFCFNLAIVVLDSGKISTHFVPNENDYNE